MLRRVDQSRLGRASFEMLSHLLVKLARMYVRTYIGGHICNPVQTLPLDGRYDGLVAPRLYFGCYCYNVTRRICDDVEILRCHFCSPYNQCRFF